MIPGTRNAVSDVLGWPTDTPDPAPGPHGLVRGRRRSMEQALRAGGTPAAVDRLALNKMRTPDVRDHLNDQHLQLGSQVPQHTMDPSSVGDIKVGALHQRNRGRPAETALVAAIRELLPILNAILRDCAPWRNA